MLVSLQIGCESESGPEGEPHTSRSEQRTSDTAWKVYNEPRLVIGSGEGGDVHTFSYVQFATRLADGRVLVADRGSESSLHLFGPDGEWLEAWGGAGDGPGEFSRPAWKVIASPDGRILVSEAMARVANLFDRDGTFLKRVHPRYEWAMAQAGAVQISACCELRELLPDGTWLVASPDRALVSGTGTRRGEQMLARISSEGEWIGEFARIPGRLWRPGGRWDPGPLAYIPMTGFLATAVIGEEVFVGNGAEYIVDVFAQDGRRLRTLRPDRQPSPFRDEWREAYTSSVQAALVPSMGAGVARRRADALARSLPSQLAAYSDMLPDPSGRLWLVSPPIPGAPHHPRSALVIDPNGRVLADIPLPPRFRPFQVGPDWILGAVDEASGVSRVALYPLTAPR